MSAESAPSQPPEEGPPQPGGPEAGAPGQPEGSGQPNPEQPAGTESSPDSGQPENGGASADNGSQEQPGEAAAQEGAEVEAADGSEQPQVATSEAKDPMDGAFMAPDLVEKVPEGSRQRIIDNVYAEEIKYGFMTAEDAERAADDSIELVSTMDDRELAAVNRDASDAMEDVGNQEEDPNKDPRQDLADFMDRHEQAEAAVDSIGRAFQGLSYIDPDRAENVYGLALQDSELNAEGMANVAKGLSSLTMVKGETTMPLWEEAFQSASGNEDKAELMGLAAWGTVQKLANEIKEARQDPEADPEAISIDETLITKLKEFTGGKPPAVLEGGFGKLLTEVTGSTEHLRLEQEPGIPQPSEEQRHEAAKRFEENFDRSKLAGDGRWN